MADEIQKKLGVPSRLEVGRSGEFTVWFNGKLAAQKTIDGFPTPDECVEGVADLMQTS